MAALAIGVSGVIGGLYHVFDGTQIAEEIGFTRGDAYGHVYQWLHNDNTHSGAWWRAGGDREST